MPTVSVVIPTYNRAHLVGRAIKSVLNQTYQKFEIIIVDDGSTDKTEEIIKTFKDERVRYIRNEKNKGASAARNIGIKVARGEYIAFQDSDDEWLPEKLEKQMKVFEITPEKVGVVYTGFWRVKNNKKIYTPSNKITKKEGYIHKEIIRNNFVTTQAVIIKKKCFKKVGMFDERLPRLQDWELWIRISKFYEFKCVDEPLVISYHTPNCISENKDAHIKAFELILEKHFLEIRRNRKLLAHYQYLIGNLLCRIGNMAQGRSYLFGAIKSYPLNIKCLIVTFVSLLGKSAYANIVNWRANKYF